MSAEVVLCMHKTTILCQFGLFFVSSLLTHISINSQPFLVGIVSHTHLLYHVAQAKQAQHGSLVDMGANGVNPNCDSPNGYP